jgi:hypothetical protein
LFKSILFFRFHIWTILQRKNSPAAAGLPTDKLTLKQAVALLQTSGGFAWPPAFGAQNFKRSLSAVRFTHPDGGKSRPLYYDWGLRKFFIVLGRFSLLKIKA